MEKIFVGYDCLKCFVSQIDKVLNFLEIEELKKREFFLKSVKFLSEIENFNCHPPEIARLLYDYLYRLLGNSDPFREVKGKTNQIAATVLNELEKKHKNLTLEDYLKFAVAGNIIDFGVSNSRADYDIVEILKIIEEFQFEINDFQIFLNNLKKGKKLLYILDNSGEAVFDLAFIKKIQQSFPLIKIIVATRSRNIINDISYTDAMSMGFHNFAKVISSGYAGPGICLEKSSDEFIKEFSSADIIVSKGQGNFETLWGETENIFFALKIKCMHVAKKSGFKLYSNLFVNGLKYDKS